MSNPAILRVFDVGPAFLLAAVAFLCDASVEFLMRYAAAGDSLADTSYSGIMAESFGRVGSVGLQICVALTNLGGLIMYLTIIGDVLSGNRSEGAVHLGVLQEWFGEEWWTARSVAIVITVIAVMLPLVNSLRFTSAVSILLAVVYVHPIRVEMSCVSDMIPAVRASLLLCSVIYATIGLAGYLLFGDETMSDVLSNFDRSLTSSPLFNDVVRLSYTFHLVLMFPLIFYSLRLNIDELLFP